MIRSSAHGPHPSIRNPRLMADRRGNWQEFLWFVIKVLGLLAGIFAFGFVIFWLRRATVGGH